MQNLDLHAQYGNICIWLTLFSNKCYYIFEIIYFEVESHDFPLFYAKAIAYTVRYLMLPSEQRTFQVLLHYKTPNDCLGKIIVTYYICLQSGILLDKACWVLILYSNFLDIIKTTSEPVFTSHTIEATMFDFILCTCNLHTIKEL